MTIRIVVVDDHVLLRDGIATILKEQPDFEVVGEAGTVSAAVKVVRAVKPDLVLMDYGLPDGTGLEATRDILATNPDIEIVLLTVHEEDDLLFEAIRSGANGYLLKNIQAKELLSRLRGIAKGEAAIMPAQTRLLLSEFARTTGKPTSSGEKDLVPLTDRELEVLQLLVKGDTNKEIATQLYITRHTVKNHVHNILEKMQVSDRREATAMAIKHRLVDTGNL